MATVEAPAQNGHIDSNGGSELSAAQKLMQKHEAHKAMVEEVPDEDDLKHADKPETASILESANGTEETPSWVPSPSAKAAGKQPAKKENRPFINTQDDTAFPELGGGPKSQAPVTAPTWSAKKPTASNGSNGNSNGASTPASGTATPTFGARNGPAPISIPGRHVERVTLGPKDVMSRAQLKKPISDVLKDMNRRSKATVTMTPTSEGNTLFAATGPKEAARQALTDVIAAVGVKVGRYF